jgi:DnaK suppressor protein
MSHSLNREIINECRKRLISKKQDLLQRTISSQQELFQRERSGDEIDQTVALLHENNLFADQERARGLLMEIEFALARIENGVYGVCEETQEPIEKDRLLAIPWTRFSIEGAEMREAILKKFAR